MKKYHCGFSKWLNKEIFALHPAADSEIMNYLLAAPACAVVLSAIDGEKM